MLSGLVLELQREALDRSVAVGDLLRKALVVSRKLGIDSVREWLTNELHGYEADTNAPDYRKVVGELKCFNPYLGWVPLEFNDQETEEQLRTRQITQAIGELDSLVESNDGAWLHVPFPAALAAQLKKGMDVPMEPTVRVPSTALVGILDAVRNQILEWSLQLEAEGVVGEGMTFTAEEKQTAQSTTYNVTNIGEVSHSQLQQGTTYSKQTMSVNADLSEVRSVLADLRDRISELGLEAEPTDQLIADVETAIVQTNSPKPNHSIIRESLRSIRTILEGAASSVLSNQVLQQIGRWVVGA